MTQKNLQMTGTTKNHKLYNLIKVTKFKVITVQRQFIYTLKQ